MLQHSKPLTCTVGDHAAEGRPSRCGSYVTAEMFSDLSNIPPPAEHRLKKKRVHAACARAGGGNFTVDLDEADT